MKKPEMEKSEPIARAIKELSEKPSYRGDERILLKGIAQISKKFLQCDSCTIWLYDDDQEKLILRGASGISEKGVDKYFYKKDEGLHWYIFEKSDQFMSRSASEAEGIWKGKYVAELYPDRKNTGGPFLGVPIISKEKAIGVLSFAADDIEYVFSERSKNFAWIIANQIAITLDNIKTRYERKILTKLEKSKWIFLSEFSQEVLRCQTLQDIYKLTTETTMRELNCRTSSIFLFNKEGKLERKYIAGFRRVIPPPEVYNKGQSFTGTTVGTPEEYGEPRINPDMNKESCVSDDPIVRKYKENYEKAIEDEYGFKEEATHILTIPLNGINRTFGVLRIINKIDPETKKLSDKGFTILERDWLIMVSNVVVSAVSNIKQQMKDDSIIKINDLLTEVGEKKIFNEIANIITDRDTSFSACIVRTLGESGHDLIVSGCSGISQDKEIYKFGVDEGIVGKVFSSGKFEVIESLNENPKGYINVEWARKNNLMSMIAIPLKNIKGIPFGTFTAYTQYEYRFNQIDIDYLRKFAKQISNIIQSIQEKRELKFINEISEHINQKKDIRGILKVAVREIPHITGFDICAIIKKEWDYSRIIESSYRGLVDVKIPFSHPVARQINENPEIILFTGSEIDKNFRDFIEHLEDIKVIVLVPIIIANKELYGAIILAKRGYRNIKKEGEPIGKIEASDITQLNKGLYRALSGLIATAIDKNRLMERIQFESERKDISKKIIREISSNEDLGSNLKTILDEVIDALDGDVGYISLLSKKSVRIEPSFVCEIKEDDFPDLEVGDRSLTSLVIEKKESYLWPSGKPEDNRYVPFKNLSKEIKSEIITPLVFSDEVIGLLTVSSYSERAFDEYDKEFLDSIAKETAVIIQNKRFYIATEKLAEIHFHDTDVKKNCDILVEYADKILENSITCLWLKRNIDNQNVLVMESWNGVDIPDKSIYNMSETEGGVSWQVIKIGKELAVPENIADPKYKFRHPNFIRENCLESMISIPLIVANEVIGVLNSYSRRRYKFLDKEVHLLKNLASKGAIAIKNAELTKQLSEVHDKILDSAHLANPGHVAMSFSHDAKHTMHNINALISSLIYLLPESIQKSNAGKNVIDSITKDTDYLRKLFNSLVKYAKKAEIKYRPVNLKEIIDYIFYIYSFRLKRNKINCRIKYIPKELENVEIECDQNQIEQVFLNLFNNSIYAIKEKMTKGGQIEIFVRNIDEKLIEVQFRDSGIGIPEENIDKVFEPFFTTKGEKGSGFGLTICRRIIEDNHDGRITVDSKHGDSTSFFIRLWKKEDK